MSISERLRTRRAKTVVILTSVFALTIGASLTSCERNAKCDPGEMCVWKETGKAGRIYDVGMPNDDSNYTNGSPKWSGTNETMNDQVTSYWNRTGQGIVFFQESNPYGPGSDIYGNCLYIYSGASTSNASNLGDFAWNPNDSFSAHTSTQASQVSHACNYSDNN